MMVDQSKIVPQTDQNGKPQITQNAQITKPRIPDICAHLWSKIPSRNMPEDTETFADAPKAQAAHQAKNGPPSGLRSQASALSSLFPLAQLTDSRSESTRSLQTPHA